MPARDVRVSSRGPRPALSTTRLTPAFLLLLRNCSSHAETRGSPAQDRHLFLQPSYPRGRVRIRSAVPARETNPEAELAAPRGAASAELTHAEAGQLARTQPALGPRRPAAAPDSARRRPLPGARVCGFQNTPRIVTVSEVLHAFWKIPFSLSGIFPSDRITNVSISYCKGLLAANSFISPLSENVFIFP